MIKVLWLVNSVLSVIAKDTGFGENTATGWTESLATELSGKPEIELTVVFPQSREKRLLRGKTGDISYIGYYETPIPETEYNHNTEKVFCGLLKEKDPDVVHIWGTEFVHSLCMVNAFDRPDRTVISIQGLISKIADHYCEGIPENIIKKHTFRDLVRKDSIYEQKLKFEKRGKYETDSLKRVSHVIGRTDWDRKAVLSINPQLHYYYGREVLRKGFYEADKWEYNKCEKHSIFLSQSYYPIKGMHYAVEIVKRVKRVCPDVKLYTTGKSVFAESIKDKLKQNMYAKYLAGMITGGNLRDNVVFLGKLDAEHMIEQYRRSNVYLQASLIENSPNSLGEAMLLGVPCVASRVGGTESIISDKEDGFLYDHQDVERAASIILDVFEMKDDPGYTDNAINHAKQQFMKNAAIEEYTGVYNTMMTE